MLADTIAVYREHWQKIHAGKIFPIGEAPCGNSWAGFQSLRDDGGYFLVFREQNDRPAARLNTWRLAGTKITCRAILGSGEDFEATVAPDGTVEFALPGPLSYALYEYA